jgi:hypothetical protein
MQRTENSFKLGSSEGLCDAPMITPSKANGLFRPSLAEHVKHVRIREDIGISVRCLI